MNYQARRDQLMQQLDDNSICVIFAQHEVKRSADANYPFEVNRNFYYFTGIDEPSAVLVMTKQNNQIQQQLFIRDIDVKMEKWVGTFITQAKATQISGIETVDFLSNYQHQLNQWLSQMPSKVYVEHNQLDPDDALTLGQQLQQKCHTSYPSVVVENVFSLITKMRMIKSADEIEYIKQAIDITNKAFLAVIDSLSEDTKENHIQATFEYILKMNHAKPAFDMIVAGGKRACVLHYVDNDQPIAKQELVLTDMGAQVGYYNADITRTFTKAKTFTQKQRQYMTIVLEAMDKVIASIKPGVTIKQLNELVIQVYQVRLKEIGLISEDHQVSDYYYHGVSHHLGLDTHDISDRSMPLQAGNVITVEPGLYIAAENIGIRIEDDILVVEDGCVNLSQHVIKTPEQLEAYLQKKATTE